MPYLDRDGEVVVLYLGNENETDNENRFHPDWIDRVHALLDEVEATEGPAALVTTATGKFYTNGLDTDHVFANLGALPEYLDRVHTVYTRLLAFPMATVAAVQGHAFGAGAMLALAHDFRVMRADRGYWSLPEVDLQMPFTVGMAGLLEGRLPKQTAVEAMTTGRRYGGEDAKAAAIVEATAGEGDVLAVAVERARALAGKRGPNLGGIKRSLHVRTLEALETPTASSSFSFGQ
ncbi:enoyl-CoA hydratase/isomerase family protein [Rhodococcus rhodnii]|uniref:Enoyl-CoA hydratase n=2 Tax=Rhodococcus rhodnii TaxID=38312 RepID=R7WJI7_9NOCA|nr:enoyl-CoA hydratase/isomerase family protein [Rhodococcus rhodnii]EOM75435.1 enoyl-CoA hydratase [Rhodococcus rhodnii LMG 5362]TXG90537.1 enoyl-CoA hydratase/isomerase family protein [Rhodococcus rhodnii]